MSIAIIIPAYNEESTIKKVIQDFNKIDIGESVEIYVIDNNSTDETRCRAEDAFRKTGCNGYILTEIRQGKAMAVKKAFSDVDADLYIMVDADDTYSADDCYELIAPVRDGSADMVVGDRLTKGLYKKENNRRFHHFGNNLVKRLINFFFDASLADILSGYRCFSKKFVKNYPILCEGFALETEMTLHALDKGFLIKEVPVQYQDRPKGSESKLNTFNDGFIVLHTIFKILKNYRPLNFFGAWAVLFFGAGLFSGFYPIMEYIQHQYVNRLPLAILATGLMICSIVSFSIGVILQNNVETHKFMYDLQLLKSKE